MNKFRDLRVYQKGVKYSRAIYEMTSKFPRSEILGLVSQLRRASYSIVLNIAEGAGSGSEKEFHRFLDIAQRSTFEVMAGLDIAKELHMVTEEDYKRNQQEAIEISVMIKGLQQSIKQKKTTPNVKH